MRRIHPEPQAGQHLVVVRDGSAERTRQPSGLENSAAMLRTGIEHAGSERVAGCAAQRVEVDRPDRVATCSSGPAYLG